MACSCIVRERPDAAAIDQDLRTKSIRRVADATGISRPTLTRHLTNCLGLPIRNVPVHLQNVRTEPGVAGTGATQAAPSAGGSATHEPPTEKADAAATATRPSSVMKGVAALYSPRWGHPRTAHTEEQRIAFLSDLIESGKFYFRRTLDGLADVWNETGAEVRRLFLVARQRLTADRQSLAVQLEITISALERKERMAMGEYRRLRKKEPGTARGYLALARQIRGDIAEFVGLRKIRMEADVNVWTRPEFVTAVDRITDASLGILLPGTEQDERGMEALCGRVEQSLGTTLSERERTLIAEALAQAAAVVDERIVQIVAEASGKNAPAGGEPLAAE